MDSDVNLLPHPSRRKPTAVYNHLKANPILIFSTLWTFRNNNRTLELAWPKVTSGTEHKISIDTLIHTLYWK
jgi:hypothetical protein